MSHASEGEIVTHAEINNLSALILVTVEWLKSFLRIQKEELITSRTLMATAVLPEAFILSDENSFCLLCSANQEGISSYTCKKPEKKL